MIITSRIEIAALKVGMQEKNIRMKTMCEDKALALLKTRIGLQDSASADANLSRQWSTFPLQLLKPVRTSQPEDQASRLHLTLP